MLLSIISPVYNVKNYLTEFVESLLKQKISDYELILVDDGSTDGSGMLCDQLHRKYKRIKVIHQKNKGVCSARNLGASIADGQYILFADSDDLFAKGVLLNLFEFLNSDNNPSIIIVPLNKLERNLLLISDYTKYSDFTNLKSLCEKMAFNKEQLPWNICSIIYRRDFYKAKMLKFNDRYTSAEDLNIFLDLLILKPAINVFPQAIINYRLGREGSADNTVTYKNVMSQLEVYKRAYNLLTNNVILRRYFANRYTNVIIQIEYLNFLYEKESCYNFVLKNYDIVRNSKGIKYFFAKFIWKIFGLRLGTKLLKKMRTKNKNVLNKV